MTKSLLGHTRRLIAAALIAAGALGVAGTSLLAASGFEWGTSVAVECPPEKEPC
jgi:hypothetical protein